MSKEHMNVDQNTLVDAWKKQLPEYLNPGDSAEVLADMANPQGLRIHIDAAGHQMYSFDFSCSYMDPREVNVELVDVERGGQTISEHTEQIQELTGDYVRHIHECAQALGQLTNP
ncbi:hypothetical protein HMSSN036_78010 [Paenibacillus macerans]|uniref:Uncharacterized protein n=1 Tax=Paenibacillus macerans TaxID=44252 RepID=A0A090Z7V5_PAEMA|nr:hypothetical protein [Paenibacillus macerans]KFN06448.1 hypothetical protein DJ90_4196 [Paenibacillus macerans]MBS5909077.1 hypothetical protein [Paenibacillus macerans]MCY7560537.1 hypothetical protein [Paenibacillus macerans]MDU5946350.1 hypothetical protein [Paenibacillus macerans]MDU7475206.1 hypothetical protein [Paenibacillus macerans]